MKTSRHAFVLTLLGLGLLRAATVPAENDINGKNVFTFYRSFERLTKKPRRVQPSIAMLCTTPTAEAKEAIKRATGPHHEALVHFYANPPGQRRQRNDPFPVGAVLIKEKVGDEEGQQAYAVGGMRKREAGFDPGNGDWEYFYATLSGAFSIGKLANCIACHSRARSTDYAFGAWLPPKRS